MKRQRAYIIQPERQSRLDLSSQGLEERMELVFVQLILGHLWNLPLKCILLLFMAEKQPMQLLIATTPPSIKWSLIFVS